MFLCYYGIGAFLLSYGAAILLLRASRSLLAYQSNAQYGIRYESTLSFMINSCMQIATIVLLSPLVGIVLVVLSFIVGLIVSFIHEKIVISLFAALVSVIITNTLLTVIRLHFGKESTEEITKKNDGLSSYVGDVKKTLTLLGLGTLICLMPIYFYTNIIDNYLKDKFSNSISLVASFITALLLAKWINYLRSTSDSSTEKDDNYREASTFYQIGLFFKHTSYLYLAVSLS